MTHPAFDIRPAQTGDLTAILELWSAMMRDHERSDERIRLAPGAVAAYRTYANYHVSHPDSQVLVAEADSEIVGFVLLTISRNLPMFQPAHYGYLSDMAVREDWRRRGVGQALLDRVRRWLMARDIHTIQLQYYDFNELGAAFWKAMGFRPYYTRMWLDLD
ncbi:MAG TPA: GNAT family N-acetyltransferase [Candidatus Sumerlaeota bacterium]|nr:MAG: Acetyltransferase YpeA [candidate division BRC1 bacterium ADurb.BinA292]HOE96117.1 GNAT family N-acetyltransferase [Candidatus Sumerlaeota bacterium]HOR26550.1 GNAT family N-acetyltransferase [Candidatus Sumerlaeota bacterium]HPK04236.1 GNAT family N-acetyltransferase [Candidatus Sumerlaeota bacterium]